MSACWGRGASWGQLTCPFSRGHAFPMVGVFDPLPPRVVHGETEAPGAKSWLGRAWGAWTLVPCLLVVWPSARNLRSERTGHWSEHCSVWPQGQEGSTAGAGGAVSHVPAVTCLGFPQGPEVLACLLSPTLGLWLPQAPPSLDPGQGRS